MFCACVCSSCRVYSARVREWDSEREKEKEWLRAPTCMYFMQSRNVHHTICMRIIKAIARATAITTTIQTFVVYRQHRRRLRRSPIVLKSLNIHVCTKQSRNAFIHRWAFFILSSIFVIELVKLNSVVSLLYSCSVRPISDAVILKAIENESKGEIALVQSYVISFGWQ